MDRVVAIYNRLQPAIIDQMVDQVVEQGMGFYSSMPRAQLHQMFSTMMACFQRDLVNNTDEVFSAMGAQVAGQRAQEGVSITTILQTFVTLRETIERQVGEALGKDFEALAWWRQRVNGILMSGVVSLSQVFITASEEIIRAQTVQIRELATPIIPVHAGVLVMPLTGAIDSHRATQITEAMLEGISSQSASVVLLDVTGVPMVDTQVANYLIQAARSARLLGAVAILVGIRSEVAQTLVQLGVDISSIVTQANLQAGIAYALRLRGLAIRPAKERG